ncbi:MAG: non-ribosomal peptide synthetase [Pseudomonadota bacterium]|nr:non-ribosomal peptide synthetase [Pseudomonadota bacterium]
MDGDRQVQDITLSGAVFAGFAKAPSRVALREAGGQVWSRRDVIEAVDDWRRRLGARGIGPSHRVATVLPNGAGTAVLLLALVDAVNLMPMNPGAQPAQIAEQVEAAGADVLLTTPEFGATLSGQLPDTVTLLLWDGAEPALAGDAVAGPLAARQPGLILQTSGSTGLPKRVPLTRAQMVGSARGIAAHLGLGPKDRAIHALPMFHIGAVVDLLAAPLMAGGEVVLARDLSAPALIEAVQAGGTWLQLVPTALAHLMDELDDAAARDLGKALRFVRMVSADLPDDLRQRAEDRLGVPVIQMYGMTETAGQITSNPLPPGVRKPLSVGPVAGPEVAIIDAHGAVLPEGREGEVCVRGETVMVGYEGDAETPRHGDWLRTGDLGRLDADGYLFLTGRVKEIINRGGEKISPVPIERAAKAIAGVGDAVAFALPHPSLGEQVGLAVVADAGLSEADILAALGDTLAEFEMPRRITRLDTMPRLASGKVDRRAVAGLARDEGEAKAARTGLAATVEAVWAETLSVRPPHDEADFFDDGGDSLSAMDFLARLEAKLGRPIPPNILFEAPRFAPLVQLLAEQPVPPRKGESKLIRHVREATSGWRGERVGPKALIIARNTVQTGPKVFIGTHDEMTINIFGKTIAQHNPLYAMRTSWQFRGERYRKYLQPMAMTYCEEIAALVEPGEEIIVGGFCGGANMVELMMPELARRGIGVKLFLAMDKMFKAPTDFPVFHIWTDRLQFSHVPRYFDPARGFGDWHPAGADYVYIPGDHDRVLRGPHMRKAEPLAVPYLTGEASLPVPVRAEAIDLATRRKRYRARVRAKLPKTLSSDEDTLVEVTVTNRSRVVWPATEDSGLSLTPSYTAAGEIFAQSWNRDRVTFDRPIAPGESFTGTVRLRWPDRELAAPLTVTLTMVDDGFGRFKELGRGAVSRKVRLRD